MIIFRIILLITSLLVSQSALSSVGGRNSTQGCVNSSMGSCAAPIDALYSGRLDRFAGMTMIVSGYMREINGRFFLFPNSESARFGQWQRAFILDPIRRDIEDSMRLLDDRYIEVRGNIVELKDQDYWAQINITSKVRELGEPVSGMPPPNRNAASEYGIGGG